MELAAQLNAIKELISQGQLEPALTQLVSLLEAQRDAGIEYAQIARVNQAEYYRLKSEQLRGIVAEDDARRITNQLTNNALNIVNDLLAGRTEPGGEQPTRSQAWRYYVAGGIVALAVALIVWRFLGGSDKKTTPDCPQFGKDPGLCVMILPFKQLGAQTSKPEFEISDGLNDLIGKTPGMKAIADVNEKYDIEKNYPNPAEAAELARGCEAQLIVWGKLNRAPGQAYSLDVRYKLLDAGGVRYSGDTTISRLLAVTDEGRWTQDVQSVTRLLYLVLANQLRTPIAAGFNIPVQKSVPDSASAMLAPQVDTTTSMTLADYYLRMKQPEKAIAEYDKILDVYPNHSSALIKRGALRYEQGDFAGAASDLEAAGAHTQSQLPALREIRANAFLKSGQPDKADQEIDAIRKEGSKDGVWVDQKKREVRDSSRVLTTRLEKVEKLANQSPYDKKSRLEAAKASLGLGDADRALRNANKVLQNDPKNTTAVQQVVEAQLMKGDTAGAKKEIDRAEKAGVNVKGLEWKPVVRPLLDEKLRKGGE